MVGLFGFFGLQFVKPFASPPSKHLLWAVAAPIQPRDGAANLEDGRRIRDGEKNILFFFGGGEEHENKN